MATWQFRFSLLPREGIKKALGRIPDSLEEYQPVNPVTYDEDREYPNYWEGVDRSDLMEQFGLLLPEMKSWSPKARMFGSDQGNRIQCWDDDIACDVDIRSFSREYVERLCELANEWDCVLVLNEGGEVMAADLAKLLEKISRSRAYSFCSAPREFLRNLAEEQGRYKP